MNFYFAPMEGITTYIYRGLHYKYFKGVDTYFTPFLSPTKNGSYTPREKKDILPENNKGVPVVPQILANNVVYFNQLAGELKDFGYKEVNLNLGCPSGTVTSKGKGSGFLLEPYDLEKFLDGIFEKQVLPISVKTRMGFDEEEEWAYLLEVFGRYPIKELQVHARVRQDFYKKPVRKTCFLNSIEGVQLPLCYNGDLFTVEDLREWKEQKKLDALMLGRGLIANPGLLMEEAGEVCTMDTYWKFLEELELAYFEELGNNALYKMKELWTYMAHSFSDVDKCLKKIRKAKNSMEYHRAVQELKQESRKEVWTCRDTIF